MKILLLNQAFYPDVVSTAQHLSELAVALAERGHTVTVVTGRRAYDAPEQTFAAHEVWRGIQIHRVAATRLGKGAKWRRAVDFGSFVLASGWRLLTLPRHDVVVALTTPPLISFIGAWRARWWGAAFGYWVMDMNPDEAIAAGWLRRDSLMAKVLERMSRFSFRQANRIIALDRFMHDRIVAKGIAPEKILTLAPWSQDQDVHFDASGRERFREQHGLTGKYVVMYSGNHSPVHPLDTLLAAADRLQSDESIVFCFVGGGSEFKRVQASVASGQRPNVRCLPYQPLAQLAASLSAADAHVVVLGEAMLGLVHPCKIYNMLAVGAPVIYVGPQPSHVSEILAQLGAESPWCAAPHGAGDTLAEQIQQLRQRPAQRQGAAAVTATFAKAALLPRLVAALETMATPQPPRRE